MYEHAVLDVFEALNLFGDSKSLLNLKSDKSIEVHLDGPIFIASLISLVRRRITDDTEHLSTVMTERLYERAYLLAKNSLSLAVFMNENSEINLGIRQMDMLNTPSIYLKIKNNILNQEQPSLYSVESILNAIFDEILTVCCLSSDVFFPEYSKCSFVANSSYLEIEESYITV